MSIDNLFGDKLICFLAYSIHLVLHHALSSLLKERETLRMKVEGKAMKNERETALKRSRKGGGYKENGREKGEGRTQQSEIAPGPLQALAGISRFISFQPL